MSRTLRLRCRKRNNYKVEPGLILCPGFLLSVRMKLDKYIGPGEKIVLKFGQSESWFFWQIFPMIVGAGALWYFWRDTEFVIMILTSIVTMVVFWRMHAFFSVKYFVTNQKIYKLTGLMWRKLESARAEQIENVNVHQSVLLRVICVGRLRFQTAGADASEIVLHNVSRPFEMKKKVETVWN